MNRIEELCRTEEGALELMESILWPFGPICPHCYSPASFKLKKRAPESKTRPGLYKCASCRRQYRVTIGTIFQDSHVSISEWMIGIHRFIARKGNVSHLLKAIEIGDRRKVIRMLGIKGPPQRPHMAPVRQIKGLEKIDTNQLSERGQALYEMMFGRRDTESF